MPKITWIFPAILVATLGLLQTGSRSLPGPDGATVFLSAREALPAGGWRANIPLRSPSGVGRGEATALSRTDLGESDVDLIFPQVADGDLGGGQAFRTVFILFGSTFDLYTNRGATQGTLEFFGGDGRPLELTVDGVTSHTFPIQVAPLQTLRLTTSGTGGPDGELAVGWARVRSEQPLAGAAMYEVRDAAGKLRNSVGVAPGETGDSFTLFADVRGQTGTGLALVNPTAEPLPIDLRLRDRSGTPVGSLQGVVLPPLGHYARFLDEIFDEYFENPGIRDFEGSVVASAPARFSGITLRATGFQLTSMPMVRPPPPDADWFKFAFPHLADGAGAGLRITTDIVLFNNTGAPASGRIDLFTSDGDAMAVTVGGARRSTIPFSLDRDEVRRLSTLGDGGLQVGWARVEADQPIIGTALFTIRGEDGSLLTEVGVGAAPLVREFDVLVDSLGEANTGIAAAWAPSSPGQSNLNANVILFDSTGREIDRTNFVLRPLGHGALFLHELFPDLEGIDDFSGSMRIMSLDYVAPLCLRQEGILLTSLPVPSPRYGFAPGALMETPQNLAGTSPPVKWSLYLEEYEPQAEEMVVFVSGASLNQDVVLQGKRFGYGVVPWGLNETQVFELYGGEDSDSFVLVQSSSEFTGVIGGGEVAEIPGQGVEFRLRFEGTTPYTIAARGSRMDLLIQAGLLVLPPDPGDYDFEYHMRSVAARPGGDGRVVVKRVRQFRISAPDSSLANLTEVSPSLPARGDLLYLKGTNFGESAQVIFPTSDGEVAETAFQEAENGWAVMVPGNAVAGAIRVDNGAGPGNPFQLSYIFGPSFRLVTGSTLGGSEADFRLEYGVTAGMFSVEEFAAVLHGVDFDPASLAPGTRVGSGIEDRWVTFEIRVVSSEADSAVLGVYRPGIGDPWGTISLERKAGPRTALLLEYTRTEPPETPLVMDSWETRDWAWDFDGLKVTLPDSGQAVAATARLRSSPTGFAGAPVLESIGNDLFVTR